MKNPFKRFRPAPDAPKKAPAEAVVPEPQEQPPAAAEPAPEKAVPEDRFTEWRRSQVRGGIERRERNDIYEAYTVYGTDENGSLSCRYYHRYPEHERDFDLSYTRALRFEDFCRRLLSELDRGDMKLTDCNECIRKAAALSGEPQDAPVYEGFSESELAALKEFCAAIDTLKDKNYLHRDGILSCDCESVVGAERLTVRFRKPLPYDALSAEIPGVRKESVGGYEIDNMWAMGVYNRLYERCSKCTVTRLTSEWSVEKESVWVIAAEGFDGIDGTLLTAVAESSNFRRFGFYSLDFSNK